MKIPHEYAALQRILQDGDERAIARQECRPPGGLRPFVDEAESDERLACARNAGDKREYALAVLRRVVDEPAEIFHGVGNAG